MSSTGIQLLPQQLVPLMPILDAMSDGVLVVDACGSIIAVNKSMRRFYQGGETPFPGYPLADFNAADWVEAKRVLASGKPLLGQTMHLPAATVVANRLPILQNGTVAGVVCAMQEISALDAVVRQLGAYRELDCLLKGSLEALPQAVLVADAEGRILRVNASCCRLCGMERDSLQGRHIRELEKDFPELAVEVAHCLQRALPAQNIARRQERPLLLWSVPSLDSHKKPRYAVVSLLDIGSFDYVRQQLEESSKTADEPESAITGDDIFSQVTQDVGLVARSAAMRRVVDRACKVSQTDSSVLLQGESGVGKSMLAAIVHRLSPRKNGPFVSINCGAIPEQLMESELFGYERGAFSGANPRGKAGLLEAAHGGTVFFDEIGELPLPMQVKLLEVLDKHAFLRVGGTKPVSVDVRIVAATNRNLAEDVDQGRFRKDLFYRLNVIPILIPPLRDRKEDIYALALDMLDRHNARHNCRKRLSPEVIDLLLSHPFPGNARELGNIMEWMLVMSEGNVLRPDDLPLSMRQGNPAQPPAPAERDGDASTLVFQHGRPLKDILFAVEEECLRRALERCATMNEAAQLLGMHPTTLWRKLGQHNMGQEGKE